MTRPRSEDTGPASASRLAGLLAAALLAAPALAGCDAMDSMLGREAAGPVDCARYQDDAPKGDDTAPLLMLYLDISDNSAENAGRVAEGLRPYLDAALREGQYIRLVASGGGDAALTYSDCFDGGSLFKIDRNNDTREEKDRTAAVEALTEEIDHVVQSEHVSPTGSVTKLLSGVNDEIATLRAAPGVRMGSATVVVWSDLLGSGETSDCLNVDGKKASVQIAEAMVRRCFSPETQQLRPIADSKVRFLGVNVGAATKPQQDIARYLKGELCRRISSDCG
ncbi:hypothetical protein UG55_102121 [Frankia sp. EI5c]|uniref:hypothetical protein n=1 Tax=Frankia sp. EI5c TaxID=683316 RepID=UPI0007C3DAC4|nr:hypothetical protein [Frankia sp. EI5c]OAA25587.1 hypothetical protein UG55_102121 [Frankia sp. EI5c]